MRRSWAAGLATRESLRSLTLSDVYFTPDGALLYTSHPFQRTIHLRTHRAGPCLVRWFQEWLAVRQLVADDFIFSGRDQRGRLKTDRLSLTHLLISTLLRTG